MVYLDEIESNICPLCKNESLYAEQLLIGVYDLDKDGGTTTKEPYNIDYTDEVKVRCGKCEFGQDD